MADTLSPDGGGSSRIRVDTDAGAFGVRRFFLSRDGDRAFAAGAILPSGDIAVTSIDGSWTNRSYPGFPRLLRDMQDTHGPITVTFVDPRIDTTH